MLDQCLGVLRVPLQGAAQAWVVKVGQGFVQPSAELAQFGHQAWRHVFEAGQRLAVDVVEQAYAQWLAGDVQCQQRLAGLCGAYCGYGQALFTQVGQGGVLGFQFDLGVAAVAGLEYETALGGIQAEVQVLLAAQRRQVASQVVMRLQQGLRLGFA
ncbi:hypothetical protein D3C79_889810 [compost metagenome]